MTFREKLSGIRKSMQEERVDAYIITSQDPHISEYVPDFYKCIVFASGFSGSAGTLVITQEFAGLWTDARYFVQAEEQLKDSGFELVKLKAQHTPEYIQWLYDTLPDGATVAFDEKLLSVALGELLYNQLSPKGISFKNREFLNNLWPERPALPTESAFLINEEYTGKSTALKLKDLRAALGNCGATYQLLSSLDDIAWLFNIRGKDVSYNPVVLCFAIIAPEKASLFIDRSKLSAQDIESLAACGTGVIDYQEIEKHIAALPAGASVFVDPARNCYSFFKLIPESVNVIRGTNPTTNFKAVKNEIEIANTRSVMLRDGVALSRFFKWLEENTGKIRITELSAAEKLKQFRQEQEGFIGISFNTIAGYKAHGALPHYAADAESDAELTAEGLFLLDSGGQYLYGTTDITRVIPMGNNTEEESTDYTLVLKAMIDGSRARFPKGTRGSQIDAIVRSPLWEHGINYGHGTGHGVGFFLNVHEGPQVINPSMSPVALEPGMISSMEPGIYRPGKHGIRIENLLLTVENAQTEFDEFYAFETLTFCYIDSSIVNKQVLGEERVNWLNRYNQAVFEKLSPLLSDEEVSWLRKKTAAI